MNKMSRAVLLASAAAAVSLSGHAWAEAAADAPAATGVEEVIVTARKTSEKIEDVPLAITAFNVQELASRGISGLKDIAEHTPGLVFQTYTSTFDSSPTVRGLSQFDVTSSQANVSTVVNGVYIPRNYSVDLGVGDISQVEIVKGPQSALYGSNAFAGVIAYTLSPTTAQPHADFSLTGGTAGRFDVKADASGSLFDDKLELRGYYAQSEYNGTWHNSFPTPANSPYQDLGGYDNKTYGFDAKFKPISRIEVDLNYFHLDRHDDPKPSYAVTSTDTENAFNCGGGTFICGPLSTNPGTYQSSTSLRPAGLLTPPEPGFTSSTDFFSAQLKAELAHNLDFTYVFGHVRSYATEITSTSDDPVNAFGISYGALGLGGPAYEGGPFFAPLDDFQKEGGVNQLNSHEARVDYSVGHLKIMGGFYYSAIEDTYEFNIWQAADGAAIVADPTHPLDFTGVPFTLLSHHLVTDTTAEFGRIEYDLLDDRLKLAAEVRHAHDSLTNNSLGTSVYQSATFDSTTPRFTIDFKLTPDTLLYASAAKGVKEGGFNGTVDGPVTLPVSQQSFQPESNWTYEAGTKNVFFGGRAIVNADVFLVKWSDLQIQEQPSNAVAGQTAVITTNIGAATSYGVEASGDFAITRHLDTDLELALINPTFDTGTVSQRFVGYCDGLVCPLDGNVGGKVLPRTSRAQIDGGVTYKDTLFGKYNWNIHGEFTYQSSQEVEEMNLGQIPGRILFNASGTIKGDKWDVTVWGKNIFNKHYVADSFFILAGSVGYDVSLGELATMGVTLNVHY
jgi:iron complex outermembrane receptor protein